jgi:hypothetical protein
VPTGFNRNNGLLMALAMTILGPVSRRPQKGAETLVWLATSPDVANVSGGYFFDQRQRPPSTKAQDTETARRLWEISEQQEVGYAKLRERGIDLIAADNPGSFLDNTPTAKLVRQVLGAIAEFDKAMTVAKLRGARERKRALSGKCEGRKSHAERHPDAVALAKKLRRRLPEGGQRSLRTIAAELARAGYLNERGRPFAAASVSAMLKPGRP